MIGSCSVRSAPKRREGGHVLRQCGDIEHRSRGNRADEDEVDDGQNGATMSAEAYAGICPRCRHLPPAASVTLLSRSAGVGFGVE
jgi:hypothetical protein